MKIKDILIIALITFILLHLYQTTSQAFLHRAEDYLNSNLYDKAIDELEAVLNDPSEPQEVVYYLLGEACSKKAAMEAEMYQFALSLAIEYYQLLLDKDRSPYASYFLGRCHLDRGDSNRAVEYFNIFLQQEGLDESYKHLAILDKKVALAKNSKKPGINIDEDADPLIKSELGYLYARLKIDQQAALSYCQSSFEQSRNLQNDQAFDIFARNLAWTYLQNDRLEDALYLVQESVKLEFALKDLAAGQYREAMDLIKSLEEKRGQLLFLSKFPSRMKEAIDKARKYLQNDEPYEAGRSIRRLKTLDFSKPVFKEGHIEFYFPSDYLFLSKLYFALARQYYQKALDLVKKDIDRATITAQIGFCSYELEDYEGAVEYLEKPILQSLPPEERTLAHVRLAGSYHQMGEGELAQKIWTQLKNTDDPWAKCEMGYFWLRLGIDKETSLALCKEGFDAIPKRHVSEILPEERKYYINMATAYYLTEQYARAIETFNQILYTTRWSITENDPTLVVRVATCYFRTKPPRGIQTLSIYVSLSEWYREALQIHAIATNLTRGQSSGAFHTDLK